MNSNDYRLSELIAVYDNFVPPEDCNTFIQWFEDHPELQEYGKAYGGEVDDQRNEVVLHRKKDLQIYPHPEDPISHLMSKYILGVWDAYSKMYPVPTGQPLCARDYSIRVYKQNDGWFKEHVDQSAGPNVTRIFGIVLFLNDVEEGGETNFTDLNICVKAKRGRIVIFPCNYLFKHEGCMPVSGDKYAITSFINFVDKARDK